MAENPTPERKNPPSEIPTPTSAPQKTEVAARPELSAPAASPAVKVPPRIIRTTISGISLTGVEFDSRSHKLAVIDQPGGPGSRFSDAAAAGNSLGALAALNAGFFTPEGAPLGLVVANGKSAGSWNSASSLGSAIWYENHAGISRITRRTQTSPAGISRMSQALQAGPLLVENAAPVAGLEAEKTSARSIVLWDGGTRWMIARTAPCTLAAVSRALATEDPAGWNIATALNLDGGRSSDLWISEKISGGPATERPFWNKPVRNFLALLPR